MLIIHKNFSSGKSDKRNWLTNIPALKIKAVLVVMCDVFSCKSLQSAHFSTPDKFLGKFTEGINVQRIWN